jgi:hypothetical protein
MALRAAPAKGLAIGAIAGTFTIAAILLGWPDPAPLLVSRVIPMDVRGLPLVRTRPPALSLEQHSRPARPPVATRPAEAVPLSIAAISPEPAAESPAVRSVEEPPMLSSRSMTTFSANLIRVSRGSVETPEPSRQSGAVTRAMGTTAGAFRTAGTSVASAFRRVF